MLLSPRRATRRIPKTPFKVLDAPDLQDDYYLNLLDWSAQNVLAVGLGPTVYLWNASTCQVNREKECSKDGNESERRLLAVHLCTVCRCPSCAKLKKTQIQLHPCRGQTG